MCVCVCVCVCECERERERERESAYASNCASIYSSMNHCAGVLFDTHRSVFHAIINSIITQSISSEESLIVILMCFFRYLIADPSYLVKEFYQVPESR